MDWVDDLLNYMADEQAGAYKNYMFTDIDGKERPITQLKELHDGDSIFAGGYCLDILENQKIEFDKSTGACKKLIGFSSSEGSEIKFDIRDLEAYFVRSDLSLYDVSYKYGEFYHSNFYIAENEEQIKSYFENNKDNSELVGYKKVNFYELKYNKRGKSVVNISYENVSDNTEKEEMDVDRYPDLITSAIEYLEEFTKGVSKDYANEETDSVEKFLMTTGVVIPMINDLKQLRDDYQRKFGKILTPEEKQKLSKQAKKAQKNAGR